MPKCTAKLQTVSGQEIFDRVKRMGGRLPGRVDQHTRQHWTSKCRFTLTFDMEVGEL